MSNVTIQKRGKFYQYKFEIAKIDGKRKFLSKSGFKTKSEAEKEGIIAYNNYLNTGNSFSVSDMSYSDFLDYWIEKYCYVNLKYHTIEAYQSIIKNHIKPNIGFYRLSQITRAMLQEFINQIYINKSFSKNFLNNIKKVIKCSMNYAYEYDYIKINPAIGLKLPKYDIPPKDPAHIFTNEEINMILERFKNNHCVYYAFLTAYCTGLRIAEVFALTWDDIDFENKIIKVKHNVYAKNKDNKGKWYIGDTKTETGERQIYICNTLLKILEGYKQRQTINKKRCGTDYYSHYLEEVKNKYGKITEYRIIEVRGKVRLSNKINLVFVNKKGKYSGTDSIRYPFKIIHNEFGLNNCRFYDLRGTYATKILHGGAEIRDVADLLGHSKIETTENYYISSTEETRKKANEFLEKTIQSDVINKIINFEEFL